MVSWVSWFHRFHGFIGFIGFIGFTVSRFQMFMVSWVLLFHGFVVSPRLRGFISWLHRVHCFFFLSFFPTSKSFMLLVQLDEDKGIVNAFPTGNKPSNFIYRRARHLHVISGLAPKCKGM